MKKVNPCIFVIALVVMCGQTAHSTTEEQTVDIWTAAATGNLEAIKQHLKAGTDVDAKQPPGGGTALLVAGAFGRAEAAKFLIEKGANVNATSNDGATAQATMGQRPCMVPLSSATQRLSECSWKRVQL